MVSRRINILFIGGAKRFSLAERFLNSGKLTNSKINLYSYEIEEDVPISGIAEVVLGLKWNDNSIEEHIIETIANKEINIALPFVDPAVSILANVKERLIDNKNVFIPVSSKNICDCHFNKIHAQNWFNNYGFPIPEQVEGTYPIIAKPIKGSASMGIVRIKTPQEFDTFKQNNNIENYLIQRFIEADEFSVDCYISKKGETLGIVPRKRLQVVLGEVSKSITTNHKKIVELSQKILSIDEFRGPITIQFLEEQSSKKIYLMEINPRFGGGVINSIEAGFDVPTIILNEFLNIKSNKVVSWKENLLMMRVNREVFKCK